MTNRGANPRDVVSELAINRGRNAIACDFNLERVPLTGFDQPDTFRPFDVTDISLSAFAKIDLVTTLRIRPGS